MIFIHYWLPFKQLAHDSIMLWVISYPVKQSVIMLLLQLDLCKDGLFFSSDANEALTHSKSYMWCVARFNTMCTILKNVKNTHGGVLLLAKLQAKACNFTKSNTPSWVFFTFFKLYEWYQIAQSTTYWKFSWEKERLVQKNWNFLFTLYWNMQEKSSSKYS